MLTKAMKEKLSHNKIKNINLIHFFDDYELLNTHQVGKSFLLKGKSDQIWCYFSCENESDFKELLKFMNKSDQHIVSLDTFVDDYYDNQPNLDWALKCEKMIYEGGSFESVGFDFEPLLLSDATYIQSHNDYGDFTDVSYIEDRINIGLGYGLRENDQLVAWVLTHDDGAIGFIKVLESHRKQGIAFELSKKIINELLSRNMMPFVHIESSNDKSIKLSEKIGFRSVGSIKWYKLK